MNKFYASIGILALGTAGLSAAQTAGLSHQEMAKPWSVSASVRAFYDDNYLTRDSRTLDAAGNPVKRDSFGIEVSPSASLNLPLDQTFIGLSYIYQLDYYFDRSVKDHSHQFNAKLDHSFTERYKLELSDSFVVAQQPTVLDPTIVTAPLRTEGNNIRNTASAYFTVQMTQLLGVVFGYQNTFYDYEQTGVGSRSALLDRMEHLGSIDLRWQMLRQTIGILGYRYGDIGYTSKDAINTPTFVFIPPSTITFVPALPSSIRNERSHYAYIGADHNFNSKLNGSIRIGGQFTDFYNQGMNTVSPYADLNLTYSYAAGSYLLAGLKHQRAPIDINTASDMEATTFYLSLTHRITGKITAALLGQYQHSQYEESTLNPLLRGADELYMIGLNLSYRINPYWTAEAGYNFDRLDSDVVARSYTRNRVYLGLRATY